MFQNNFIPCSNKRSKITYTKHDAVKLPAKRKKGKITFLIAYVGRKLVTYEKT